MIELYHCANGRSFRCLWLLEEMGLPYRLHLLPFPPRVKAPEYLELNPLGTVPLLVDGETRMIESAAILEYLTVRHGPTPLGVAPDEPAYGAWLNWLHLGEATLTTPQTVVLRYGLFEPEERRQPIVQSDYTRVFLDRLIVVDAALRAGDHLCAGRFTAADISVGYALMLAPYIGAADAMSAPIRDYWARLQQRPGFTAALAAQQAPAG